MSISKAELQKLADVVREITGNNVQEKNFSMLESRMSGHLLKLGLKSLEDYWTYYKSNETLEREVLQGLMTTHYTFFFREYVHFENLAKWIEQEAPRLRERYQKSKTPVQVWSAACSRGQEVYSLAMFLEFNLTQVHQIPFEIIGTDIDPESVAFGRNGVYPIKEVNTIAQMYLQPFWKKGTGKIAEYAAANSTLRSKCKFDVANLLELSKWSNHSKFDVIFCRNVFIYFSEENVRKIAGELLNRLDDQGLLVSGLSEPLRFKDLTLSTFGPSSYRKPQAAEPLASTPRPASMPTASPKAPTPMVESFEQKKYTVLCVDDSPTIQLLMKKIFGTDPLCAKVDVAGNGQEARQVLNQGKYDLITLDIHMPVVSGIEFLEKLYDRRRDPPVIMISSVNRSDLDLATKSISLGAFDYVEKPAMNNLQKSMGEILTKVKMALRSKPASVAEQSPAVGAFDASIGQKIIVPDASQCLRVVLAHQEYLPQLEHIVRGQSAEYRSPALVVVWRPGVQGFNLESEMLNWTSRPVLHLRDDKAFLKPNSIYVAPVESAAQSLQAMRAKTVSLQVLDREWIELEALKKATTVQTLIDETLLNQRSRFESLTGFKVSDVTPATSFPSLSVEFFANLRKAA